MQLRVCVWGSFRPSAILDSRTAGNALGQGREGWSWRQPSDNWRAMETAKAVAEPVFARALGHGSGMALGQGMRSGALGQGSSCVCTVARTGHPPGHAVGQAQGNLRSDKEISGLERDSDMEYAWRTLGQGRDLDREYAWSTLGQGRLDRDISGLGQGARTGNVLGRRSDRGAGPETARFQLEIRSCLF